MSVEVRSATLGDVPEIVAVFRSNVRKWRTFAVLGRRYLPYERLTLLQRYRNGGPWMAPETCALHIQQVQASGNLALVAVHGGRVAGYSGLLFSHEPAPWGHNAKLDTIYVHKDLQRKIGAGTALIQTIEREARAAGCNILWAYKIARGAGPFYARCGFVPLLNQVRVTLRARQFPLSFDAEPLAHPPGYASDLPLVIGHYASSQWLWASPERWRVEARALPDVFQRIEPICFRLRITPASGDPPSDSSAYVYLIPEFRRAYASVLAWTRSGDVLPVVQAIVTVARRMKFRKVHLLFQEADWLTIHEAFTPLKTRPNVPHFKQL